MKSGTAPAASGSPGRRSTSLRPQPMPAPPPLLQQQTLLPMDLEPFLERSLPPAVSPWRIGASPSFMRNSGMSLSFEMHTPRITLGKTEDRPSPAIRRSPRLLAKALGATGTGSFNPLIPTPMFASESPLIPQLHLDEDSDASADNGLLLPPAGSMDRFGWLEFYKNSRNEVKPQEPEQPELKVVKMDTEEDEHQDDEDEDGGDAGDDDEESSQSAMKQLLTNAGADPSGFISGGSLDLMGTGMMMVDSAPPTSSTVPPSSSSGTGRKKSDFGKGSSCHQCKNRREADYLVQCCNGNRRQRTNDKRKKNCRKKYCDACIKKFYKQDPNFLRSQVPNTWECPACHGRCQCAACKKRPTFPQRFQARR